jgi:acetylornithine deacetylase/succinyl-diaminopimelate desuccinylase-like protein
VTLRDAGFYLRGRINVLLARALNARSAAPRRAPLSLAAILDLQDPSPLDLARLFEGRPNAEREALVGRYMAARDIPFATHRFQGFEGVGVNYVTEVGAGERVLVLIAHHDAVPGSPGANDNAAAVGILLRLLARMRAAPPERVRLRFLFTAAEELGYLGARAWVRDTRPADVAGVVSLELCGIGDSPVLWDHEEASELSRAFAGAAEALGRRRDETYHLVGRIPVFGSDHRAFAAAGVPAYGLTVVPAAEADTLRRFIFHPWRSAFRRRPRPFDTYHTARDACDTVDPAALDLVGAVLERLARAF